MYSVSACSTTINIYLTRNFQVRGVLEMIRRCNLDKKVLKDRNNPERAKVAGGTSEEAPWPC